jgi:hypothetical protein
MHKGLHEQIGQQREPLKRNRAVAADPDASPQAQHNAEFSIGSLERTLDPLCRSAHTGENAAAQLDEIHAKLSAMPSGSAELTLAIRDLETASFRLRRHLGAKPD